MIKFIILRLRTKRLNKHGNKIDIEHFKLPSSISNRKCSWYDFQQFLKYKARIQAVEYLLIAEKWINLNCCRNHETSCSCGSAKQEADE